MLDVSLAPVWSILVLRLLKLGDVACFGCFSAVAFLWVERFFSGSIHLLFRPRRLAMLYVRLKQYRDAFVVLFISGYSPDASLLLA
jgi:hypothetical protein